MSGITKIPPIKPVMGTVKKDTKVVNKTAEVQNSPNGNKYEEWEKDSAGNEKAKLLILPNPGKTAPYRAAAEYDQVEIVKLLLAKGADINATDKYGRTAPPR